MSESMPKSTSEDHLTKSLTLFKENKTSEGEEDLGTPLEEVHGLKAEALKSVEEPVTNGEAVRPMVTLVQLEDGHRVVEPISVLEELSTSEDQDRKWLSKTCMQLETNQLGCRDLAGG